MSRGRGRPPKAASDEQKEELALDEVGEVPQASDEVLAPPCDAVHELLHDRAHDR
jgi:hypothetical protein